MKYRKHQEEILAIAEQIIRGERTDPRPIVCDVVPGGGKTAMFMLFACRLIDADVADQVIVIVPRRSLQKQTEQAWSETSSAWMNPGRYALYSSRNEAPLYPRDRTPLFRGTESPLVGIVATNGQLLHAVDDYIELAKQRRTVLFIDEIHFMGGDDADAADTQRWARDVIRLSAACAWTVVASGSLFRASPDQAMALVTYEEGVDEHGRRQPVRDVYYSIKHALSEQPPALKPIRYKRHDAALRFEDNAGEREVTLSTVDKRDESKSLATFLRRPEVWQPVVEQMLEGLLGWRTQVSPSRGIIIADRQESARAIEKFARARFPSLSFVLATSDEEDAHAKLAAFRKGGAAGGDVLVTVGMASVGFDVPDCTHMALLTSHRSKGSLLQYIMRIGRIDNSNSAAPDQQSGFVWAPKDKRLDTFMEWLRGDTREGLIERETQERERRDGDQAERMLFIPLGGELGSATYETLDGRLADEDAALYENLCRVDPSLAAQPADVVVRAAKAAGRAAPSSPPSKPASSSPSDRIASVRKELHSLASRIDYVLGVDPGTTSKRAAALFGPVQARPLAQLEESHRWLTRTLREAMLGGER